jgi:hypothetical protein
MSNGGTAYAQRKAAAETFADSIKDAANNPAILRINVLEKASKIVVVAQDVEPFIIENNDHSAEDLATIINERLS